MIPCADPTLTFWNSVIIGLLGFVVIVQAFVNPTTSSHVDRLTEERDAARLSAKKWYLNSLDLAAKLERKEKV